MTAPMNFDDPYLPLAFSLHSNPGAYALLAGAGVSRGAGLPTAWDIVVTLVDHVAHNLDPNLPQLNATTAGPWYETTFGTEPTYSELLAKLAPTAREREALLRGFFERRDEDTDAPAGPSRAHHAVASLMEHGAIGVIVTMNFDRLFETALRGRGIEPAVVVTDSDAQGLPPLHTVEHCVIHLHGDYRNSASMLNTTEELSRYQPHMQQLLEHVLRNYGLLVAGWSVQHDHALKQAVAAHHKSHFSMGWVEPGSMTLAARELATNKNALILPATADEALGRLDDQVTMIRERQARHPLSLAVAASRIKRQLAQQHPAIPAHDMVAAELGRLTNHPAFQLQDYNTGDGQSYTALFTHVAEATRLPAGCVATLAYWGDEATDGWWLPELERLAQPTSGRISGNQNYIELPQVAAARLFYAAGIAAAAARRYTLLDHLMRLQATTLSHPNPRPLSELLAWNSVHSHAHRDNLQPEPTEIIDVLTEVLGLSSARIDEAWQSFDILRVVTHILNAPSFHSHLTEYEQKTRALTAAEQLDVASAMQARTDRERTIETFIASCRIYGPHIFVTQTSTSDGDRWISARADRMQNDTSEMAVFTHHLPGQATDRESALSMAFAAASKYFGREVESLRNRSMTVGRAMWLPSELWLDAEGLNN